MRRQWTFLRDGKSKGVPISPFLDMPAVVIKDKNEEVRRGHLVFCDNWWRFVSHVLSILSFCVFFLSTGWDGSVLLQERDSGWGLDHSREAGQRCLRKLASTGERSSINHESHQCVKVRSTLTESVDSGLRKMGQNTSLD